MPKFTGKIIQLLETMVVRHGVMVVGTTGVGKSTLPSTLSKALGELEKGGSDDFWHKSVHVDTLNPKAVTMGELYGETNILTNEWTEGLVSKLVKDAVAALEGEKPDAKRWICFDGPVDALWIENMNTVLDDNKMLCLANGQRIKMPGTATMLFEVNDLKVASPATVSRCGMVYLEPVHLGWEPHVATWKLRMGPQEEVLKSQVAGEPDEVRKVPGEIPEEHLTGVTEKVTALIRALLPVVRGRCREVVPSVDANLVQSFLALVTAFLGSKGVFARGQQAADPQGAILTYLAFSACWSLGANLHDASRSTFGDALRSALKAKPIQWSGLPDGDVYGLGVNRELHTLVPWAEQIPSYAYDPLQSFFEILVPTADTVKYSFILRTCLAAGHNVLLTGETGVGKSVVTKDFLGRAPED